MAREENAFALLGDDEADDVLTFLARVAKKAEASSKSSSPAGSVRGTGGDGRGPWWSSENDLQQFDKGRANGYQRNNRSTNGYQSNNGGTNGYQRYNGGANGYRRNIGSANGYQNNNGTFDGYQRNYSRGNDRNTDGGGRGRGGGERRGNGGGGGYRARRGRVFGARDGRNHESGEVMNGSGAKNALSGNDNGNTAATTEVSRDAAEDEATKEVRRKAQEEWEKEMEAWEARRKAREEEEKEDAKKLTLKQYQQLLLEKRKALEALNPEERKVDVDTNFESMLLVGRKKEDKLKKKDDSEKDKLKKKDDKVRKSVSITEFLKPAEGYSRRSGAGRGSDGYGRGSSFRQAADPSNGNARKGQFQKPVEGEQNVDNFERRGGQGGYRRGTSAEPTTGVSQRNGYVVPAIQDAQQFPDLEAAVKKN